MNKFKIFILLIIALSLSFLGGCTNTIEEGKYGPFNIGESKISVLNKISEMGIKPTPITYQKIYIESPSLEDFKKLDNDNGILVWLDKVPFPLRIVLENNKVLKTWGNRTECGEFSKKYPNKPCDNIGKLAAIIKPGKMRNEVYKLLDNFDDGHSMQIGNFVVGYQEFRTGKNKSQEEYNTLLLRNNAWSFEGLRDLLWYDHFYSKVNVYFKDDKLIKIEHEKFPFEMP